MCAPDKTGHNRWGFCWDTRGPKGYHCAVCCTRPSKPEEKK